MGEDALKIQNKGGEFSSIAIDLRYTYNFGLFVYPKHDRFSVSVDNSLFKTL